MRLPIKTFEDFRDALSAYRLPRVILTALELKLFTVIGKYTWLLPDLARELKVSERGLSILCRNLAMAGLLYKKGNRYRNSPLAATARVFQSQRTCKQPVRASSHFSPAQNYRRRYGFRVRTAG